MVASTSSPMNRLLSPLANCLNNESAQRVIEFEIDPATRATIDDLARKANEGQLSENERQEYFEFVEAMDLIALLQHQARQVLRRRNV